MSEQKRKTRRPARLLTVGALVLAGLVTACDEAEQNRPLHYEKGTYQGPPDTALTEEQRNELRARGRLQSGN